MITKFFKGMRPANITQGFHDGHKALDIVGSYGTPMCAPEDCLVLGIRGDGFTPNSTNNLKRGYGVSLLGKETGTEYLIWHCLPYLPVWGGDSVKRGQIVAFMGNSGYVLVGGIEVVIDERPKPPYRGTHLHVEGSKNGVKYDLLPEINWSWEPTYTKADLLKATMVCLTKMLRALSTGQKA